MKLILEKFLPSTKCARCERLEFEPSQQVGTNGHYNEVSSTLPADGYVNSTAYHSHYCPSIAKRGHSTSKESPCTVCEMTSAPLADVLSLQGPSNEVRVDRIIALRSPQVEKLTIILTVRQTLDMALPIKKIGLDCVTIVGVIAKQYRSHSTHKQLI